MNRLTWALREVIAGICLVIYAFLLPAPASANVGPPTRGGQIVAEPIGLQDVAITRETLTIDLRPLTTGQAAHVEAVYQLDNRGPERKLDLIFASGSEFVTDFEVWLGDRAQATTTSKQSSLPPSWQPPNQTPGIHDDNVIGYHVSTYAVTSVAFSIVLPPGRQALKVRYRAEAVRHQHDHPMIYWQFAYILAPARAWGSFGGLDVTVYLPENWQAACTLPLKRDGNVLQGSFSDLPSDAIGLTLQAPVIWSYAPLFYGTRAIYGMIALGGAYLCWRMGRSQSNPDRRAAIGSALLWGFALFAAGAFAVQGPRLAIPELHANTYGYGVTLAMVGVVVLSLLAVPVGFAICITSATRLSRDKTSKDGLGSTLGSSNEQPGIG